MIAVGKIQMKCMSTHSDEAVAKDQNRSILHWLSNGKAKKRQNHPNSIEDPPHSLSGQ